MVGRVHAVDRGTDRAARQHVAGTASPGPADEHVVDAPIGLEIEAGVWVGVRPGEAGLDVSRRLPRVVEHETGHRHDGAAGEHADLLRVGHGIEIARDDRRHHTALALGDEPRQGPHLLLPDVALIEAPVEVRREDLEQAARPVDLRADHVAQLLELDRCRKIAHLVPGDRPARQDGVADGDAVDRVPVGVHVVEAELPGEDPGLVPTGFRPHLLERDQIRIERGECGADRLEPRLPGTAAAPQIPRNHSQPGLEERAELERLIGGFL